MLLGQKWTTVLGAIGISTLAGMIPLYFAFSLAEKKSIEPAIVNVAILCGMFVTLGFGWLNMLLLERIKKLEAEVRQLNGCVAH